MFEESALSIWASMNSWLTPTVLFLLLNLMIGTIAIASSFSSSPKPHDQVDPQQHQHQGLVRSTSVLQRFKSINFYSYRSPEPDTHFAQPDQLVRSSSILQRLQSIKFQFHFPRPKPTHDVMLPETETEAQLAHYASEDNSSDNEGREEPHEEIEMELLDDDVDKFDAGREDLSLDEIYKQLQMERHVSRTTSDTKPASGEVPANLPRKMRKSASAKSASAKSAFGHFAAEEVVAVERRRPATVREMKKNDYEDDDVDGGEVDAKADDFINRFKQQLKLQRIDSIIRYKDMIKKGSETK